MTKRPVIESKSDLQNHQETFCISGDDEPRKDKPFPGESGTFWERAHSLHREMGSLFFLAGDRTQPAILQH